MILVLTDDGDVHADHVITMLRERGAEVARFNPSRFPSVSAVSISLNSTGQVRATLHTDEEPIDLTRLQSVWCRRPDAPVPHPEIADGATRDFLAAECHTFMNDLWACLDCLWVPAPPHMDKHAHLKAAQLTVAGALGFELPPTLVTNDPRELLEFYRRHDGQIVSKLAGFAFRTAAGTTFARYTEAVSKRDIGYARTVRYCPIIVQARVPKHIELRVTVVGRRAFAAEIHSQASNHTRLDWRRYDMGETPHRPHDLHPEVERRCIQLVERLGLCYGAIDLVLTPDGRYVFLEINPNGQYLWIEHATGLPISDAICDLLTSGTRVSAQAA